MVAIPMREWALRIARRSRGIATMPGINPDSDIFIHPNISFRAYRDGRTFTQPAIRGLMPQEVYSI